MNPYFRHLLYKGRIKPSERGHDFTVLVGFTHWRPEALVRRAIAALKRAGAAVEDVRFLGCEKGYAIECSVADDDRKDLLKYLRPSLGPS